MTESEAAMQIGQAVATILVAAASVPAALAAPIVAIVSLGSFFFGKKYERKWNRKYGEPPTEYEIEVPSEESEQ